LAEIKLLTKDSTEVPFEVTEQDFVGSPVFLVDAGGLYEAGADRQMRFVGTQGVARDISERKKAEETIRLSEEKYRMLFESSPDPVLMLDLRGAILDCNRAALDFIARPRQDLIGRKFWNLTEFDPQDVRYMQRKFLSLLRGNPVEPYVLPVRRTEGKTHWFEVFSTAVRRDDGLVGVQIISRDITERKLAEEELIGSRSMLQLVLDSVPQRIFWKDRNGVLLGANRQFAADHGLDRPDLVRGKTDYDLLPNPAQAGFFREHDRQVIESGEPIYRIVEPLETPDGRQLWLETSKMPLRDSHGRVVGVLGAYEDITQRVRDEEEREKRRLQLIQADKMISLGVLVAGVAHEINNPNNFIMMNAPILRNAWESCIPLLEKYYEQNGDFMLANIPYSEMRGHVPELFEGITDGADRINSIVKNLLDYARQDNSSLDQKVDLNEVVRIVLALLANQIKKSTDCFRVDYAAGLPLVYGNFQRIEQVVLNVLQNACQALTDRSQAVEVSTAFAGPANEVLVRVKDEGEGISPEALPHVMDPFFTTRRDRGGTGLGLSISSGIMEDHGGRLEFDSEVGRGTVVSICFPAEDNGVRSQTQEVG
ncbi:MAG: PAS domain S-box protein, partial [Candidatus Glassbacteria bacterium]